MEEKLVVWYGDRYKLYYYGEVWIKSDVKILRLVGWNFGYFLEEKKRGKVG